MLDFFGKIIKLGDTVAFYAPGYRMFTLGKVISFTHFQVRVEYNNTWNHPSKGRLMTYLGYPTMFIVKV